MKSSQDQSVPSKLENIGGKKTYSGSSMVGIALNGKKNWQILFFDKIKNSSILSDDRIDFAAIVYDILMIQKN
jgi:hypothetical protein